MKVLLPILFLLLAGCGTLTPKPVTSSVASFDGNDQTSGVLSATPNGYLVTGNFRARYNSLAAIYGRDFVPDLKPDDGLVRNAAAWVIDRQHLIQFLEMNAWHRAGLKPKNL